jgi:dolichol-phosphate mannosyltransferase
MKLSVIIPTYNEENTIMAILKRVLQAPLGDGIEREVVVIDDGSVDSTSQLMKLYEGSTEVFYYRKENGGKGSAVRYGIEKSTGDIVLVQDADLEYDPNDYQKLIEPIISGETSVVYGSRELSHAKHSSYLFYLGGQLVTIATNLLFGTRLTDEPTCYKVFDAKLLKSVKLESTGFEFCPEITAKVLRKGVKIKEIPISYTPRDREHGKKIKAWDGVVAIWTLLKYRLKASK